MSSFETNITLVYDLYNLSDTNTTALPTAPTQFEKHTLRNALIISCYTLIVIVSLCGNLLVCKIAFTKKKMRTTTNILIASLACSDVVMTAFNIPFNIARLLLPNWPFGPLLCFFVPFIQTSCVYVSTFTMTAISLHRWRTISKRSTFRSFSCLKLAFLISLIWILAMIFALPIGVFNRLKEATLSGQKVLRCRPQYPKFHSDFNFPLFLSVEILLTQYFIPLTITCIVYVKIGCVVYRQGKLAGQTNDDRKRRQIEAKRRRIIMLALAVIVFAVCWAPINLYHLFVDFKVFKHDFKVFVVCHWLAMSSVCYNPFIYCYYNASYRAMVKESLECVFRCLKYYKVQQDNIGETCVDDREETNALRDHCTKFTVCNERIEMLDKSKINIHVK